MRAGKLDRQVTIQRLTETGRNAYNAPVLDWADLATVFAQQRPNRGAERFEAQQTAGAAVMTFHIRWFDGLRRTDRLVYDGRVWNITDVRELGRRDGHEIDAVARAD